MLTAALEKTEEENCIVEILDFAGLWASYLGGYLADRFGKVRTILIANTLAAAGTYMITQVPFGFAALILRIGIF